MREYGFIILQEKGKGERQLEEEKQD